MYQDYSDYLLVVDDQAGIRQLLREVLSNEGYFVETVANGTEALRKVSTRKPSLILLDQRMPGISGLETLSELKKISQDVPVVMISACYELDTLTEAKKHGMVQHHFIKPFDLDEVRNVVSNILAERNSTNRMKVEDAIPS